MVTRNPGLSGLAAGYLFPEIARRRRDFATRHPEARIISLGIGNTTEPLTPHVDSGLVEGARRLAGLAGYSGYGDELPEDALDMRKALPRDVDKQSIIPLDHAVRPEDLEW